jgi:methyltransferase (TIGR00027 family)
MKVGRSSQSAQMVAMVRAAHAVLDEKPPIFDDSIALALVDPEFQSALDRFRDPERLDPIGRKGRAYVPFRQYVAEHRLAEAWGRGTRQYVLLGAGLDSYAFRQPRERSELRIFEVDHPATQAHKRQRVSDLGWPVPENLVWTPCDFESTPLSEALERVGFDRSQATFFSWLGVLVYLEPETVREGLQEIARLAAPGSELVFEFGLPTEDLVGEERTRREISLAQRYRPDEPFRYFCRLDEIEAITLQAGFDEVEAVDHEAEERRLLAGRGDDLSFRIGFRLAMARR